jgi:Tol biopolymer transport system component
VPERTTEHLYDSNYSPDGRQLAFASDQTCATSF